MNKLSNTARNTYLKQLMPWIRETFGDSRTMADRVRIAEGRQCITCDSPWIETRPRTFVCLDCKATWRRNQE